MLPDDEKFIRGKAPLSIDLTVPSLNLRNQLFLGSSKANVTLVPDRVPDASPCIGINLKDEPGVLALHQVEFYLYGGSINSTKTCRPKFDSVMVDGVKLVPPASARPGEQPLLLEMRSRSFSTNSAEQPDLSEQVDADEDLWPIPIADTSATRQLTGWVSSANKYVVTLLGVAVGREISIFVNFARRNSWSANLAAFRVEYRRVAVAFAGAATLAYLGERVVWPPLPGASPPPAEGERPDDYHG